MCSSYRPSVDRPSAVMAAPPAASRRASLLSLVTSASSDSLASGDDFPSPPRRVVPPSPPSDAALNALWESHPLVSHALGEWLTTKIGAPRRRWRRSSSPTEDDSISDVSDVEEEPEAAPKASWSTPTKVTSDRESAFDCVEPPAMPPAEYAARLAHYSYASSPCLVLATVYMDRVAARSPSLALSPLNVHRLLLAALGVAAKVHDDASASARHYALVGGVEVEEVAALEMELLLALSWRTYVSEKDYARQLRRLVAVSDPDAVAAAVEENITTEVAARKARTSAASRPTRAAKADERRPASAAAAA